MNQPAYYIWNAGPVLFSIGSLQIRWYGSVFAVTFLCGYEIMAWVFRQEEKPGYRPDLCKIML